jgi:hypothetical protein
MGGRLEVDSRPGRTAFTLTLPLAGRNLRDGAGDLPAATMASTGGPEA